MTIVVSGLPATGRTTLALALGRALVAPVFSRDPIMAALYGRGRRRVLERGSVPATGLELQTVLLARQLELGQPAILECVAPRVARQRWREMTLAAGHRFTLVECVCTDPAVHRARFEQRHRNTRRGASGWDQISDPQLTSMFTTFSRLSRNEHMPAGERLRTHAWLLLAAVRRRLLPRRWLAARRRLRSGAPARLTGWLCYPIAALILVVMIVMTAHSGAATCTGATPPGAARDHAQIKTCASAGNSALLHGH